MDLIFLTPAFDPNSDRNEDRYETIERRAGEVVTHAITWLNKKQPGAVFYVGASVRSARALRSSSSV